MVMEKMEQKATSMCETACMSNNRAVRGVCIDPWLTSKSPGASLSVLIPGRCLLVDVLVDLLVGCTVEMDGEGKDVKKGWRVGQKRTRKCQCTCTYHY